MNAKLSLLMDEDEKALELLDQALKYSEELGLEQKTQEISDERENINYFHKIWDDATLGEKLNSLMINIEHLVQII